MIPRSNKPAVLFVALQTGNAANGGIASIGQVITAMRRHRPVVLTNLESPVTAAWRAAGAQVEIVPEAASAGLRATPVAALRTYFAYFAAVRRLLHRTGARVVHANDPLAFQLAYPAVCSRMGARITLNIRDTIGESRRPPRRKYAALFGGADHIFFLSRDMIARWNAVTPVAATKSSATFSVVDFDRFAPQPLTSEGPRVVLLSGVICAKKGQLRFLEKVAPLLTGRGLEVWLSGDFNPQTDEYARRCAEVAAERGNGAVRFLGYRADMPELIARAHVVAVSSEYEGLMRTMIEAMAAGRPVVSTDVASAREFLEIPGTPAGAVFAFDHSAAFAQRIVELCENEALNQELGAHGAAIAREYFQRDRVVAVYEDVFARLGDPSDAR